MKEKEARQYIAELFQIVRKNSVLVVLYNGKIKRLYCPFVVIAKVDVPPFERGKEYTVKAVKMTLALEYVFIIEGKAYFVWYFAVKVLMVPFIQILLGKRWMYNWLYFNNYRHVGIVD